MSRLREAPGSLTVRTRIGRATTELRTAGIERPESRSLATWAALTGCSPGVAWLRSGAPADPVTVARFDQAIARQAGGTPFAYAVGSAGFRTIDLEVDARVLIPRPETEGLVEHVLAWGRRRPVGTRWGVAADIGTGSGAIALALAVEGAFDRIIATDISADALAVAGRNAARLGPPTPVEFRQGAMLRPLGALVCDVIVSNPPYIASADIEHLDASVREQEPRLALEGGSDGLAPTRELLHSARAYLSPGGLLAVEVDSARAARTLALARAAGWGTARVAADVFGRDRYLLATMERA
jgi:release factor glutamine methyltransferase